MNGIVLPRFNWDRYSNLVCHAHLLFTYARVLVPTAVLIHALIIEMAILSPERRESQKKIPVIESDLRCGMESFSSAIIESIIESCCHFSRT